MAFVEQRLILIADDNRDLAISLSLLLKLTGFDVETVHNGRDALAAAKIRRPDILLLDIGLPGLNGYQVAREFRSDDTLKNVLIIAISGYSAEMFAGHGTPGDFNHYFTKPVEFRTLLTLTLALTPPNSDAFQKTAFAS